MKSTTLSLNDQREARCPQQTCHSRPKLPQGSFCKSWDCKRHLLRYPLPSIDIITSTVKKLGKGCLIYKLDIIHIKLDPSDYDLLGFCDYAHYVDTCLPFGYRNGSALFQCVSDTIVT